MHFERDEHQQGGEQAAALQPRSGARQIANTTRTAAFSSVRRPKFTALVRRPKRVQDGARVSRVPSSLAKPCGHAFAVEAVPVAMLLLGASRSFLRALYKGASARVAFCRVAVAAIQSPYREPRAKFRAPDGRHCMHGFSTQRIGLSSQRPLPITEGRAAIL